MSVLPHIHVEGAIASRELANKHLIDEKLWGRLVNRIAKDESMEVSLAERIMDQALAFLKVCAANKDSKEAYSPSPLVDIGWHTFILYTKHYAAFCEGMGGFIHHEPTDDPDAAVAKGDFASTLAAMRELGLAVDADLWVGKVHCEAGCCSSS